MTKEESIKYLQQLYPNGGHCWLDEQRIEAIGMAVKALQEEPVSENLPHIRHRDTLDEFAYQCAYDMSNDWAIDNPTWNDVQNACKLGANWQKQKDSIVSEDLEKCAKEYVVKEAAKDISGNWATDNILNAFKAGAKWQKEHKKCMYSKDNYTNEDRKVICDGCEEECEYSKKKEPVSEDFEKALAREWHGYNDRGAATVDALEDNTQELAFAKGFYRGAKWQKKQMMAKAVEGVVHHFEKCKVASVHYNDPTGVPMAYFTSPEGLSAGDKVKINVIKED